MKNISESAGDKFFFRKFWQWYGLERRAPSRLERIRFQPAETVLGAPFQQ